MGTDMAELQITIEQVTEQDYDGVNETTKHLTATIDGAALREVWVEEDTVSDATAKANFRAELTTAGYSWDTEV